MVAILDDGIELAEIKARSGHCVFEVFTLVPSIGTAKDERGHLGDELKPAATALCFDAKCAEAVNVGLLRRDGHGCGILYDRVRARPREGQTQELRASLGVAHNVEGLVAIRRIEHQRWLADGDRIDDAHAHVHIVVIAQTRQIGRHKIGIGAAERPVNIDGLTHCVFLPKRSQRSF